MEVLNDPNFWIDAEDDDEEFRLEEDEEENDQQGQQETEEETEERQPEQEPERKSPEPSPYNTRSRCPLVSVEIDEIARLFFFLFHLSLSSLLLESRVLIALMILLNTGRINDMEEEIIDSVPLEEFLISPRPAEYDEFLAGLIFNRNDEDLFSSDLSFSRLRTPTFSSCFSSNNNQMLNEDPSATTMTTDMVLSLPEDEEDSDYSDNDVAASPDADPEELRTDNGVKVSRLIPSFFDLLFSTLFF